MKSVFLNIGSNLGDRRLNLSRAVAGLERVFGPFEASHVVETPAWGYESDHPYLNIGMRVESDLEPLELLAAVKEVENRISSRSHRDSAGGYADREIDIDIIAIDQEEIDLPELKVPHPLMQEREFVLVPMQELAPLWRHPRLGNVYELFESKRVEKENKEEK